MKVARGPAAWTRRALLAVVLLGAAVIPGRASSIDQSQHCTGLTCTSAGSIRWTAALPGGWLAQPGVSGTVTSRGGAYAAIGAGLAVVGTGTLLTAFSVATGKRLWRVSLAGGPAGSAIVGVRVFAGLVAAGVEPPGGQAASRDEVMLSAATGAQIRTYPAAAYGGAVQATAAATVIVGTHDITAYATATGRVLWRRATGSAGQAWRVTGRTIYIADAVSAGAGTGVAALRRIDLSTGAERVVRPPGGSFAGALSEAVGNYVLFSGSAGVAAYSGVTGKLLWSRTPAEVELADSSQRIVYLASGGSLLGVSISSGRVVSRAAISVAASLYWVAAGVALGLDQNGLGEAWGYSLNSRRVVWTSAALPWPHFFVDLSGLGGSASPASNIVLLATCARVGTASRANSAPTCLRPELAAVRI